jgi:hypothetical protein
MNEETPKDHISDMHLRLARKQGRLKTDKQRWDNLILEPSSSPTWQLYYATVEQYEEPPPLDGESNEE